MMKTEEVPFLTVSDQPLYKPINLSWYFLALIVCKFFCSLCLFVSYDTLQRIPLIVFLWSASILSAGLFVLTRRPFSGGVEVSRAVWWKIGRFAVLKTLVLALFLGGLSQVGPYRTAFLTEHSHLVIYAVWAAIFKGSGGASKLRGTLWIILGIVCLVLFDNDTNTPVHPEGQHHTDAKHVVYSFVSWCGLSDHEGGIIVLLVTAIACAGLEGWQRILALEVGGVKRLNALTWVLSAAMVTLPIIIYAVFKENFLSLVISALLPTACVSLVLFVGAFYVQETCQQFLTTSESCRTNSLSMFVFSLLLGFIWPATSNSHGLSGGAVMSFMFFCLGTVQMSCSKSTVDVQFLLPLHQFSNSSLSTASSVSSFIVATLRSILADKNSKTIFYFLCVNLGFTFVELTYGFFTNSLGLISDGFHMLFDCSALVMGLTASVMAQWKSTKAFPFGYRRIELLSGFVNGLFLSVIGFMVFCESLQRLVDPPPINTDRLLAVAVCGLLVNLCGIFAFSSNSSSHGHSHGGGSHGHSHNANMQGVFLHILADTLGSVAVIVSSLLIDWYGWLIADPICSLVLSCLILASVLPLVKQSAGLLVLRVDAKMLKASQSAINQVLQVHSVTGCKDPHIWQHVDDTWLASLHVFVTGEVPQHKITQQVCGILKKCGIHDVTLQVDLQQASQICPTRPGCHGLGIIQHSFPSSLSAAQKYSRDV